MLNTNLLKAKFAEAGKTQGEVACDIGISANSMSRKLSGKREFRLSEVEKMCILLHIDNPAKIFLCSESQIRNNFAAEQKGQ